MFGNAFDSTGLEVECVGITTNDDVNAVPDAAGCNGSTQSWTDNVIASCPLINGAAADLHLNGGIANPCIGTGLANSPAGTAPALDIDGQTRPAALDIGADQT